MLWRRSLLLFLILVIITMNSNGASGNETKHHPDHQSNHHKSTSNSKTSHPGPNQLMPRKMDNPHYRQGLLAGPLFLGLSSLLFPVLPMLLLAPIAVAGLGPAVNFVQDALGSNQGAGSSNNNNAGASGNSEAISILQSLAQSNSGISHALQSLAQRGSANAGSQGAGSSSSLSSLASSLGSGSGMQASASSNVPSVASASSISSSVAQALGLSDSALSSGDSSSILNGITNFFGPDRNSPAGSSSLTQTLFGNLGNRPSLLSGLSGKKPGSAASLTPGSATTASGSASGGASASPADYLGAAAAALDNAGLLGTISGAGTGSVTDRLLSLVTGNKNSHQQSGALASGSSSSSALADLLGLGSSTGGTGSSSSSSSLSSLTSGSSAAAAGLLPSPASASSAASSSQQSPLLGSSLSSNIIHNLPQSYGAALNNMKLVSAKPVSSSSGSIQSLTSNALNKISNFIFSRRRSEWIPRPYPGFGYIDNTNSLIDRTSASVKSGMSSYIRDAYSVLKDGIRRYEVAEPECQARIVCELHQRPVGRSFKSWANTILDIMGVEDYLDSMKFGARTKSVMKDIYRAAKNGMIDQNCAEIYSKCPVSISVEPLKNTLFNKMLRGSGHNMMGYNMNNQHQLQQQQKQTHENVAQVYGPFGSPAAGAQSRESAETSSSIPPATPTTAATPHDKLHNNKQQSAVTWKASTSRPSTSAAPAVLANRLSSSSSTTKSLTQNPSESQKSTMSLNQKLKSRRSIANVRFASQFAS